MKPALRKEMKALLAAMAPQEAAALSRAACLRLTGLPEFRQAQALMLYLPLPGELDCRPAIAEAWRLGKTVLAPLVDWEARAILPVRCETLQNLPVGRHGLQEPHGPAWPIERLDLVVVPALAYDRRGTRLGRGGGFYDRFLARCPGSVTACGLVFSRQVLQALPVAPHDRRVPIVVTENEVLRFPE